MSDSRQLATAVLGGVEVGVDLGQTQPVAAFDGAAYPLFARDLQQTALGELRAPRRTRRVGAAR